MESTVSHLKRCLPFWEKLTDAQQTLLTTRSGWVTYGRGETIHRGDEECVGLILVAPAGNEAEIIRQLAPFASCYPIGEISEGEGKIVFSGEMHWPGW